MTLYLKEQRFMGQLALCGASRQIQFTPWLQLNWTGTGFGLSAGGVVPAGATCGGSIARMVQLFAQGVMGNDHFILGVGIARNATTSQSGLP
jgi:hypothetical protein